MNEHEEFNYSMTKAMEYLQHERPHYRNVRALLEEMKARRIIEDWKVSPNGFVKIKAGGRWRATLVR